MPCHAWAEKGRHHGRQRIQRAASFAVTCSGERFTSCTSCTLTAGCWASLRWPAAAGLMLVTDAGGGCRLRSSNAGACPLSRACLRWWNNSPAPHFEIDKMSSMRRKTPAAISTAQRLSYESSTLFIGSSDRVCSTCSSNVTVHQQACVGSMLQPVCTSRVRGRTMRTSCVPLAQQHMACAKHVFLDQQSTSMRDRV